MDFVLISSFYTVKDQLFEVILKYFWFNVQTKKVKVSGFGSFTLFLVSSIAFDLIQDQFNSIIQLLKPLETTTDFLDISLPTTSPFNQKNSLMLACIGKHFSKKV